MVHHLHTVAIESGIASCLPVVRKSPNNSIATTIINEICHIHHQLSVTRDLNPGDQVNALFTKLVKLCIYQYGDDIVYEVLHDTRILSILSDIRSLASQGEYLLELYWAKTLVKQAKNLGSGPELSRFVYFQNYVDLVQLELHALQSVGCKLNNIVFIGSGPLPLSSILLYQALVKLQNNNNNNNNNVVIHNIDRDQESITISNALLEALEIHDGLKQHVLEATEFTGFENADVVVLGALVGRNTEEKMEFLTQIGNQMKKSSFVMIRSAHSLRKVLYPCIEPYHVNTCGFKTSIVLHPYNDVVNSILIANKL